MGSGREKWWKDKRGNKLINDAKIIFPHMKKLARPENELFWLLCEDILEVINNLRRMLSLNKYDTAGKNANNEYILKFQNKHNCLWKQFPLSPSNANYHLHVNFFQLLCQRVKKQSEKTLLLPHLGKLLSRSFFLWCSNGFPIVNTHFCKEN